MVQTRGRNLSPVDKLTHKMCWLWLENFLICVFDTPKGMLHIKFKESVLRVIENIDTHLNKYSLLIVQFVRSKPYNQFIARNMDSVKCPRLLPS